MPLVVPAKRLPYTTEEVASHNSAKSLWVIMNRKVYDITAFIKRHPGGPAVLLQMGGKDATAAAAAAHKSSLPAHIMWEFCIGWITREKVEKPPPEKATITQISREHLPDEREILRGPVVRYGALEGFFERCSIVPKAPQKSAGKVAPAEVALERDEKKHVTIAATVAAEGGSDLEGRVVDADAKIDKTYSHRSHEDRRADVADLGDLDDLQAGENQVVDLEEDALTRSATKNERNGSSGGCNAGPLSWLFCWGNKSAPHVNLPVQGVSATEGGIPVD
eukprot:TRINITY_DN32546_c0_g1_i1.p1 TRINITY_DN32546_c0_g1~~TRINITY_DN32546_c0_g1_i1.p1  ORF type:complete len:278 (-),score=55.44 TRINITY_DN32546_c0_g1_i1:92-925(-)